MRGYIILLAVATSVLRTDSEITCDAPTVEKGSPANVTCHFDTDIVQTRTPFCIDKYTDGNPRPQAVLRCHWPEENSTNPRCTHTEGYSYVLTDTRSLNLQISATTEEYAGNYACLEMASDETVKHCKLTLKETVNDSVVTCDAPVVVRGSPANITCHFHTDISRTRTPFGVDRYMAGHRQVVLRCHWPDRNRTVPKCTHKNGFSYNLAATRDLTLQISSTTEDNVGPYVCQELGSDDYLEQCEITLKQDVTDNTPTSEPGHSSTSFTLSEVTDKLLLVPIGVVWLLFGVTVVVWCLCRKRLPARGRKGREKHECVEMTSYSKRGSWDVSTVDIEINSRQREQTEEDEEHTQLMIPRNKAFQSDLASGETETNPTSLTSPSQGSATRALSTDSAASPSTNGSTAGEDSSQVDSEQNAKDQAYGQAVKALQETGAVIIAGPEKCGKTTLGRDLLNHFTQEGYNTETRLRDPWKWMSYVHDPDKKYAFLFDEVFKAGDRSISQNTWELCFGQLRERHCPLVIIVQTSETKEEDVQAFSFLRNIPVVIAVGDKTKASASKTMTEKEGQPRGEVWHTTVDPSGKVGRTARGDKTSKEGEKSEEHKLDLVIFNVHENIGRGPEADEYDVKRLLKTVGVSDSDLREVTCVTRLGEKKDWPPRPVIITVKTIETKQNIIDYARNSSPKVLIYLYTTEREIEKQRALFGRIR